MKKILIAAAALTAMLISFSCDPTEEMKLIFAWGIYDGEFDEVSYDINHKPSPLYEWLRYEINEANRTVSGKEEAETPEHAISLADSAEDILKGLDSEFAERIATHDNGGCSFKYSCLFEVYGGLQRLYNKDEHIYEYKPGSRLTPDVATVLSASDSQGVIEIRMTRLGITDKADSYTPGKAMLTDAKTLDFRIADSFIGNAEITDDAEGKLVYRISYSIDPAKRDSFKGSWYVLARINVNGEVDYDVEIPITVE